MVIPVPAKEEPGASMDVLRTNVGPPVASRLMVLDVLPELKARIARDRLRYSDLFWQHDAHFNALGNRAFARAIAASIMRNFPIQTD